jgi:hypothetical protein
MNDTIKSGFRGSGAMVVQVTTLMWLRTIMNNQYRYGETMKTTIQKLYKEGGVKRFYKGYTAALAIGPLSRFGDTAANTFVLSNLTDTNLPTSVKTLVGSGIAASWRIALMPIDACKTSLQVDGSINILRDKIRTNGFRVLYYGTSASMVSTFVGHYPWFLTYNILNESMRKYDKEYKNIIRSGFIGFTSAVISDCVSNSFRVIKTVRQTHNNSISYVNIYKEITEKEGIAGLLGRGLKTRIITNGVQGMVFMICWKCIEKYMF